ncbi:Succinate--CoA ligase [ADP-forming] subunit beta mitochondrial [Zea mays]|uniref:Succinate--CoA ligase [ADP-forming] subunit beta mitochondrial n=1 Tax=Zea mays TaxID=4577 RepID=A0A1D6LTA7_MAIZE|nr:Succinate--CoA ligase [ADP-forming] subunit beta mitochondrial [Zea mays]
MVRGSLGKLASRALSVAGRWQHQQLRRLNIHEYQGAELMGKYGINVPRGAAAGSVHEVKDALKNMFPSEKEIVVKSQILAGGRGLGTFKSGLQGGVHIVKAEEAELIASKMLGQILITKQTGPEGKIVSKVYLCEKLSLTNEMYFAITLDRKTAGPFSSLLLAAREENTIVDLNVQRMARKNEGFRVLEPNLFLPFELGCNEQEVTSTLYSAGLQAVVSF